MLPALDQCPALQLWASFANCEDCKSLCVTWTETPGMGPSNLGLGKFYVLLVLQV